jgi:hypothetical protein
VRIIVFGAGGHGNVVLETIEAQQLNIEGLLDDDESIHRTTVYDDLTADGLRTSIVQQRTIQ